MPMSLLCHLILLVVLLSGLFSGTKSTSKYVCQGENVQLFQNITLANGTAVNLYINGLRKTLVSTWHSVKDYYILEGYKEKVSLDEYGTIWIRNIQLSENGKYFLQYNTYTMKSVVEIFVMVAPARHCKPNIKKHDDFLSASLEADVCGRPHAHVHWLESPDIAHITKTILKLPPENEVGTYYACAETPALRCVKNLKLSEFCSAFVRKGSVPRRGSEDTVGKDKDNSPAVGSEISEIKTFAVVSITISLVVICVGATAAIIILIKRRKKQRPLQKLSVIKSMPPTEKAAL